MKIETQDIYRVVIKVKYEQYQKLLNCPWPNAFFSDPELFDNEYFVFVANCKSPKERDEVIAWVKEVLG